MEPIVILESKVGLVVLIASDALERYDPSNMHKVYDRWPLLARSSYETNNGAADFKDIDHVIFAGMGGSGTIGDIFSSLLSKSDLHTRVV